MNPDTHTRPISARVDPKVYTDAFALCNGRDCTVSELVGQLLNDAIESGNAAAIVSKVERINADERAKLSVVELKQRLRNARKQCLLFEAAISQVDQMAQPEPVL